MTLKIYFSNEQSEFTVDSILEGLIHRSIRAALESEGADYDAEVSVTFTNNEGIRELNREYRNIDKETDVLSFPMYAFTPDDMPLEGEKVELGDIVISLEKASAQAVEYEHSYEREVAFLTVHSVLHLLGYDHVTSPEDEEDMIERQKTIMKKLNILRAKDKLNQL